MRRMRVSQLKYSDVYNGCRSRIRDPGQTSLFISDEELVYQERSYIGLAQQSELFCIEPHVSNGDDCKDNHEKLYDGHFSNSKSPARSYYDNLMSIKRSSLCPYCGFAKINHVDHFLPKATFFRYSVMPSNLVPCCSDCNTAKGEYYGDTKSSSLFHPYFDIAPNAEWLLARVSFFPQFSVKYLVVPRSDDIGWVTEARLENHLEKLKISEGYECLATENLVSLKSLFLEIIGDNKVDPLREYIEGIRDQALNDARQDVNSWKFCLYKSLLVNEQFFSRAGINMIDA